MKKWLIFSSLLFIMLSACTDEADVKLADYETFSFTKNVIEQVHFKDKDRLNLDLYPTEPLEWGEFVNGVKTRLDTDNRVIALTFDACGGPYGSHYDEVLINYLIDNQIPATLFVNKRWIESNNDLFMELANNPLFQIENHGTEHLPLSINGKEAWGIKGTKSAEEIVDEVMDNHFYITNLTGQEPTLFRSGTAFYDEVAVQIVQDLGLDVVNFDILGDAGGTYTKDQVKQALLSAQNGSIALLHMNQPSSETAEGVMEALPILQERGFEFVLLKDYELE